ncbi:MAG: superoxide dismutase family protein [Gemmatimonadota bacterium]|nr:MAG: superoxide dismutase family protein [Gemmatimonadota bacterium]
MREKRYTGIVVIATAAAALAGCAPAEQARTEQPTVTRAVAVLYPTAGSEVRGTVTFVATDSGILVRADLTGLPPGEHGIHIHELGDCSAPDGTSAGGHFNPDDSPHGAPDDQSRHVGDLGNLTADDAGLARYERTDARIALGGHHSIVGRAVIVHAGADDLVSQPTGSAGARAACGVIGIADAAGGA